MVSQAVSGARTVVSHIGKPVRWRLHVCPLVVVVQAFLPSSCGVLTGHREASQRHPEGPSARLREAGSPRCPAPTPVERCRRASLSSETGAPRCCACSRVPPFERYAVIPVARNVWQHVEGGSPSAAGPRDHRQHETPIEHPAPSAAAPPGPSSGRAARLRLLEPARFDAGAEGRSRSVVSRNVVPLPRPSRRAAAESSARSRSPARAPVSIVSRSFLVSAGDGPPGSWAGYRRMTGDRGRGQTRGRSGPGTSPRSSPPASSDAGPGRGRESIRASSRERGPDRRRHALSWPGCARTRSAPVGGATGRDGRRRYPCRRPPPGGRYVGRSWPKAEDGGEVRPERPRLPPRLVRRSPARNAGRPFPRPRLGPHFVHIDGQRRGDGVGLLPEAAKVPDGPGERLLGPLRAPPPRNPPAGPRRSSRAATSPRAATGPRPP